MADIVTLEFIKSYFPDQSDDSCTLLQTRATSVIEEYLRTSFTKAEYTEVSGTRALLVPYHLPIISVLSVQDSATSESLVEGTDYIVTPEAIKFPLRTAGTDDLTIKYEAGLLKLPALVSIVAEDLVRFWAFKQDKLEELFFKSESMEDRSYTSKNVSELAILARLSSYRYTPLGSYNKNRRVRIGVI